jgi:hypothetical protein
VADWLARRQGQPRVGALEPDLQVRESELAPNR